MTKRVLLISAAFPPQAGGASEKMAKRAKYLHRFGWQTTVLAPAFEPDAARDNGLAVELEEEAARVVRTRYLFMRRLPSLRHDKAGGRHLDGRDPGIQDLFFVPRGYVRWIPFALARGLRLARSVDVILTINNPVTLHLVGLALHLLTGKPWVVELRDPIVGYSYGRRGPEGLNRRLERLIFTHANAIIQRGDFVPDDLAIRHPDLEQKITVIPYTGFDAEDYTRPIDQNLYENRDTPLTISYTGNFYGSTITPDVFLQALHSVVQRCPPDAGGIQVYFAGGWDSSYDLLVSHLDLDNCVSYLGWLSHQDCLSLWERSHLLLLILGSEAENLNRIPSKFWDYLGARRPILALVPPEGRLASIIQQQKLGFVADPNDVDGIAKCLRTARRAFTSNQLNIHPRTDFLHKADRAKSEMMVQDVLQSVLAHQD